MDNEAREKIEAIRFKGAQEAIYRFRVVQNEPQDIGDMRKKGYAEFASLYNLPRNYESRNRFTALLSDEGGVALWVDRKFNKKVETALGLIVTWPGCYWGGSLDTYRSTALYLNRHWHDNISRIGFDNTYPTPEDRNREQMSDRQKRIRQERGLVLHEAVKAVFGAKKEKGIIIALAYPGTEAAETLAALQTSMGREHVSGLELPTTIFIDDLDKLGLIDDYRHCSITRRTRQELLNPPVDKDEERFNYRDIHTFKGPFQCRRNRLV